MTSVFLMPLLSAAEMACSVHDVVRVETVDGETVNRESQRVRERERETEYQCG